MFVLELNVESFWSIRLFLSSMTLLNTDDAGIDPVTSYKVNYNASTGNTITECIAAEIWSESPNRFFSSIADILPIVVVRGAKNVWGETKPLAFEEDLYMGKLRAGWSEHGLTSARSMSRSLPGQEREQGRTNKRKRGTGQEKS